MIRLLASRFKARMFSASCLLNISQFHIQWSEDRIESGVVDFNLTIYLLSRRYKRVSFSYHARSLNRKFTFIKEWICSELFVCRRTSCQARPNRLSGRRASRLGRIDACLDKRIGQRPIWLSVLPAGRPADTWQIAKVLTFNTSDTLYVRKVAGKWRG